MRSTDAPPSYDCVHEHGSSSSQCVSPSRSSPRRSSPRCWPWSTFGQKSRSISPRSLIVTSREPLPRIAAGRNAYRRPVSSSAVVTSGCIAISATSPSTTGDVETEPSLARATATNETGCPRRKSRGSTKTPYGAPSSVPTRVHFFPGRLTANVTLNGSTEVEVAAMRTRFVKRSGATAPSRAPRRVVGASTRRGTAPPRAAGSAPSSRPFARPRRRTRAEKRVQDEARRRRLHRDGRGRLGRVECARYSRRASRSILLTTSVPSRATRTNDAPVESAGCASRSAPSARRCCETGCATRSNEEPVPTGADPTRSSVRHSATLVGKRSCRAALSPPRPTMPTSSP